MLEINDILDTQQSKLSFMKGLIVIAQVDGKVDECEKKFFTNAMLELKLNNENISNLENVLNNLHNITDLNVAFDSRNQELFFFREAIQLCYIDGSYSKKERELIENIRTKTTVNKEDILKIENWVKEGIEWSKRGEKLLEMGLK